MTIQNTTSQAAIQHRVHPNTYITSFLVPGCDDVALVGNGFCNDETNNADCNYDGGDCCVVNENTNSCSECFCHFLETCAAGYHPLVGNGFCNDDTNIVECGYDGGDCCGYSINSEYCTECTCFHQETCLAGVIHVFVGDGVCNDKTNIAECEYDGGDCCGSNVDLGHCTECACHGKKIFIDIWYYFCRNPSL